MHAGVPIPQRLVQASLPSGTDESSITPRGGDGVQAVVAKHVRDEAGALENFREGCVANAEAAGIGAERGHYRALAVAGKAAPLHRTAARRHARLGMQM